MKMKSMFALVMIAIVIISMGIASATENVAVSTDKANYDVGEDVIITLTNNGQYPVTYHPSWVENSEGKIIYSPNILMFYQELGPGESRVNTWDQTDDFGKLVEPGQYTIRTKWDSTEIRIEAVEEIITVSTDKVNYGVGDEVVVTFTNDGNGAVLFYPEWVEDANGKIVRSPRVLLFPLVLESGESTVSTWGQTDDFGKLVAPGQYTIRTKWDSTEIQIEAVEEIITVSTDKVNYGVGDEVVVTFTNDGNGAVLFYPEWVEDAGGKVVRSPRVLLFPLVLEPGESTVSTWDQTDDFGKLVEPGQYTIRTKWDSTEIHIKAKNGGTVKSPILDEEPIKKFDLGEFKGLEKKENIFHGHELI